MCMQKVIIIFLSYLFIFCYYPCFGSDLSKGKPLIRSNGTIEYDFSKQSQKKASKILYEYVLKDLNKTPKEAQNFANITPKTVKAFETDLNNDGQNEIIGVVFSTFYSCTEGLKLFILENKNKSYTDLTNVFILPDKKIYVNNGFINNYKEINFKCYNNHYRLEGEFVEANVYLIFENSEYTYNYSKMKSNI